MVTDTFKAEAFARFQVSDITISFSDITGFAGVTTDYPPEVWIDALYECMSEMTDILFQYEGVLDNYEGDSIMGPFGAPKAYDDHAVKGCRHATCLSELGTVFTNHQ
jgi:adenylate cyclase